MTSDNNNTESESVTQETTEDTTGETPTDSSAEPNEVEESVVDDEVAVEETRPLPLLELHVSDSNVTTGSIPVTWCISPEIIAKLKDRNVKEPMLVLVVSPVNNYHERKEYRKVVPLKDMMAYLEFKSKGPNKIWAFISEYGPKTSNTYLSKRYNYDHSILQYDGEDYNSAYLQEGLYAEPLEVEVPAQAFAAPPSELESAWVNWFHSDKPYDQCQFRRRRLLAYTVQPFAFAAIYLVRIVSFIIQLLIGARGATVSGLLHPLDNSLSNYMYDPFQEGTIFLGRGKSQFFNYARLIFMPAIFIPLSLMIWHACHVSLFALGIGTASILAAAALLGALYISIDMLLKKYIAAKDSKLPWYLEQEEQQNLFCSPDGKKGRTFKDLPSSKKTLRLRFYDLKSKVCRPFSE